MKENKELVVLETIDALQVFTGTQLDPILSEIEKKAFEIAENGNLETTAGRKVFASAAYKVSQSKTLLDNYGKELVSDWKKKAKIVDKSRKKMRDYLDDLKERVRKPLTEYEKAEAERIERERLQAEFEKAHEEALADHALWLRMKELEAKEAELKRIEEERKEREEAERIEKERKEREEIIRKEAAQKAKEDRERAIRETQEAERKKYEAEQQARAAAEAKAKAEAERIARDKKHRARVNNEAKQGFIDAGFTPEEAINIVKLIASGKIKNVVVQY